jgi:ketosteroid isomerase-like protein
MTTTTGTRSDLAQARARNESRWRASALALYAGDTAGFLDHWVANPRYTVAYPVEGMPRTVEGRDAFLAMFGGFAAAAAAIEVHDVEFHQTDDPDVVFVQERMTAELHDGGRYENVLVIRVRFHDGLISDMLEYYGEVAHRELIARSFGGAQ